MPVEDATLYVRQTRLCPVLTDPKRLRLLAALRHGERSVGDLAAKPTNVSQHLALMRDVGLVGDNPAIAAVALEATTRLHRVVDRLGGTA
jgi:DNA-binding transcriptional ArsR family regulator